jgi:hypothetical protein
LDLFIQRKLDKDLLQEVLIQKFAHKNLNYPITLQTIPEKAFITAKADWEIMLKHQVPDLEPIEHYTQKFTDLLSWIVNT